MGLATRFERLDGRGDDRPSMPDTGVAVVALDGLLVGAVIGVYGVYGVLVCKE